MDFLEEERWLIDENGKAYKSHLPLMEWYEASKAIKRVDFTSRDGVDVSTVFLGRDHAYFGDAPLLFETMVFGGEFDQEQERYSTLQEAKDGHAAMVKKVWPE